MFHNDIHVHDTLIPFAFLAATDVDLAWVIPAQFDAEDLLFVHFDEEFLVIPGVNLP
jgi:hypothetical protein